MTDSSVQPNNFQVLMKRARDAGLFHRKRRYFYAKGILNIVLLATGFALLSYAQNVWLTLLDAFFLAFVYGQIGLLGHDSGHRQIFQSTALNNWIMYPCALCIGMSSESWMHLHNEHHAHPNHEEEDPDFDFPVIAFSEFQAKNATGLLKFCSRFQHWIFPFILPFYALSLRLSGLRYMREHPWKHVWLDALLFALHFALYFGFVFSVLPFGLGILFVVVHQLLFGAYLGSIFAPNHKGMETFGENEKVDFVREQVLTSRNIRGGVIIDFLYGGLNYQIEHHLFPNMPRNHLGKAQKIVKEFCREKNISYHEVSWFRCYVEILSHLKSVALYARTLG